MSRITQKSIADKNACQTFINWGHRGASGHQPENTLVSFQTAMAMGADGIECDIRESRDGRIMIFHDPTLKRIAGRPERIDRLTFSELRKIDAGDGEQIPELKALFQKTPPDFLLNLEIKQVRPEKLLDLIYRHNAQYRVLISSFYSEILIKIRSLDSAIRLGYLVDRNSSTVPCEGNVPCEDADLFKKANTMKAQSLHFSKRLITEDRIARVHREGFLIYAYTIDAPNQMSRFMKMGMDGLFTNYPDRLSRVQINDRKIK